MSEPCRYCGALDHGVYCPSLGKDANEDFTKEELRLLAHGFGFFVQEFSHDMGDEDPARLLLTKLFRLSDESGNESDSL